MKKSIFLVSSLLLSFAANSAIATEDMRSICENTTRTSTEYYGWVSCRVRIDVNGACGTASTSTGNFYVRACVSSSTSAYGEYYQEPTGRQFVNVPVSDYENGRFLGYCENVRLPYSVDTPVTETTCRQVPFEPYVDAIYYEYGACSGAFRNGFIDWSESDTGVRFEVEQRSSSGRWSRIYSGRNKNLTFGQAGGTTHTIRIRGYKSGAENSQNGYGTWRTRTISAPACGSPGGGGGPHPH